ncbi:MAG: hypothetical protein ACTSR3_10045 [Candidatus Helarchaeota archaeon]
MERRRIRQEEEKEKERKKKELKKTFRKRDKEKVKSGFSGLTATKIILIIIAIATPIVIIFVYNYYIGERQPNYSFLTEGDEVYGTLNSTTLNFTHTVTNLVFASTAQYMNFEITDNYPYDTILYQASYKTTFHSVLAIPYDVHPNDHHEGIGDTYMEFMLAFVHNVPDMLYVLRTSGAFVYPSVIQWNYQLNGTNLQTFTSDQEKYFFTPTVTVEPGNKILTKNVEKEIHVTVNLTAGYFHTLGLTEIKMIFTNSDNLTFSDPEVFIGGLQGSGNSYTFISRRTSVGAFTSILLDFNITVNSTEGFTDQNILSSGGIFFQFGGKGLQNIYPTVGFGAARLNVLGIPDEKQIEAFIYMARLKYLNYHIDTPLIFDCV